MSASDCAEVPLETVEAAWRDAHAAAQASGVSIRNLVSAHELTAAERTLRTIWEVPATAPSPLTASVLRALEHLGSYVAGAYLPDRPDEPVGVCAAFFGEPRARTLHSHIAGITAMGVSRGIGRALKLHQRAWALERGTATITWTYDPLIARNAYFNVTKLGARLQEYLVDFYGEMSDGLNGGTATDRVLVSWDLLSANVARRASSAFVEPESAAEYTTLLGASPEGVPVASFVGDAEQVRIVVPADIEALRRADPQLASRWRIALREALAPLIPSPDVAVDRAGAYLITRSVS